jgi:hypothetical protein
MPDWFADAVDRTTTPDLPPFDPDAALAGVDADPGTVATRGGGRSRSDGSADGRTAGAASGASGANDSTDAVDDHPLSDVWGE